MTPRGWARGAGPAAMVCLTLLGAGCAWQTPPRLPAASGVRETSTGLDIHGERLTLHLAAPAAAPGRSAPLVLYASGDGGWFGAAVGMFRTIAAGGVPVVGFSTRALMKIEHATARPPLTAAHVGETYDAIIQAARRSLSLPADVPVVLTGWSRGASLGILVASLPRVDPTVAGVVAIGLARFERLDVEPDGDDDPEPGAIPPSPPGQAVAQTGGEELEMYAHSAGVAPRRCVVIQASRDNYLPAAQARALFGADTDTRRFVEIEARNHRFGGGRAAFAAALQRAVAWVAGREQQAAGTPVENTRGAR